MKYELDPVSMHELAVRLRGAAGRVGQIGIRTAARAGNTDLFAAEALTPWRPGIVQDDLAVAGVRIGASGVTLVVDATEVDAAALAVVASQAAAALWDLGKDAADTAGSWMRDGIALSTWPLAMAPWWWSPGAAGLRGIDLLLRDPDELTPGARARGEDPDGMRAQLRADIHEGFGDDREHARRDDVLHALEDATPVELAILSDLRAAGLQPWQLTEVLKGGHVVIDDGGKLFRQWRSLSSSHARFSSHYGRFNQYAVDGAFAGEALFGLDGDGNTFIQLEKVPMDPADPRQTSEWREHFKDGLTGLGGDNKGPWGTSKHTDPKGAEDGGPGPIRLPGRK